MRWFWVAVVSDRFLAAKSCPAEMITCTSSAHVTVLAWCQFIHVRHVYKYWQVDTLEVTHEYSLFIFGIQFAAFFWGGGGEKLLCVGGISIR